MYGCVYSIWTCSQLDREKKECFKLQYEPSSPAKGRTGNGFGTQSLVHSNKTAGTVQPTTPFRYPLIISARNNTMFENFFKKKKSKIFYKKLTLQNILLWKQSNFCKLFSGKKRRETARFDLVKVGVRNLGISAANSFILLLPISLGVSWL
jgi:hypothetical protein